MKYSTSKPLQAQGRERRKRTPPEIAAHQMPCPMHRAGVGYALLATAIISAGCSAPAARPQSPHVFDECLGACGKGCSTAREVVILCDAPGLPASPFLPIETTLVERNPAIACFRSKVMGPSARAQRPAEDWESECPERGRAIAVDNFFAAIRTSGCAQHDTCTGFDRNPWDLLDCQIWGLSHCGIGALSAHTEEPSAFIGWYGASGRQALEPGCFDPRTGAPLGDHARPTCGEQERLAPWGMCEWQQRCTADGACFIRLEHWRPPAFVPQEADRAACPVHRQFHFVR